jgi:tetratricopeptide (TPR) repeat protein
MVDYESARHWLNNSYAIHPDLKPSPAVALILVDIINHNLGEASKNATKLVLTLPDDPGACIAAGDIALISGDPTAAGNYYQKALMISPKAWHPFTGINATTSLGFILKKTNHFQEAEEMINYSLDLNNKTLNQGSQWWGVAYDMAAIQAIKGDTEACFIWLAKALENGFLFYSWLEMDPLFESVRDEPEFLQFVNEVKSRVSMQREF